LLKTAKKCEKYLKYSNNSKIKIILVNSKYFSLSFILLLYLVIFPQSAEAILHPTPNNLSPNAEQLIGFSTISLEDLLSLNAKELGIKRGKKLKLKERVALFVIKREIKRARRKGQTDQEIIKTLNEPRDSSKETVAFILGLLLNLIGVLIAYLFLKKQKRFAWYGLLTYFGIYALVLFYTFYNF